MSDLISRCELFNRLATIRAEDANEMKGKVYSVIQGMDSYGWIPIEQGLPQEEGAYLLTIRYRYAGIKEMDVVIDRWVIKDKQMTLLSQNKGEFKMTKYADVIAWMPLPKGYEL